MGNDMQPLSEEGIITVDILRELTGYESDARVATCLEENGIPVFRGKAGCWTTYDLITLAGKVKLGIVDKPDTDGDSEIELA